MRTILALSLFLTVAQGQEKKITQVQVGHWYAIENLADSVTVIDTLHPVEPPSTFQLMQDLHVWDWLDLYSRFEKEAMKDSVWIAPRQCEDSLEFWKDEKGDWQLRIVTIPGRWIHPNAPPANLFIEWLRKQSGIEGQ